jgi:Fe-S-cluster-containing hydrogenase component 2
MKRNIITIDEDKCTGCGLCITACHEGALELIDGKAVLVSETYCDGLGNCLPECPTGAIQIVEKEAAEFDDEAVKLRQAGKKKEEQKVPCSCPSTHAKTFARKESGATKTEKPEKEEQQSELRSWPIQIQLVNPMAPFFEGADLLIAADCTAYSYAGFHDKFMKDKITIIGCPKLDDTDYADKMTEILENNEINSVTIVRMEVPCCGGIVNSFKQALQKSGKIVPWQIVTITTDGEVMK